MAAHLEPPEEKIYFDVSDYENDEAAAGSRTPPRKSGESSPTTSVYEHPAANMSEPTAAHQPLITYHFYHTASHLNIQLTRKDGSGNESHFYVDNSMFTPGKPDVTLHTGQSKDGGQVVGVCRFNFMFGTFIIGLGDPGKETPPAGHNDDLPPSTRDVHWHRMKRHGMFTSKHWEFSDPYDASHLYHWKRTHEKALGASLSTRNKKLVDVESGKVVAVFAANTFKSWKKMGKLEFFVADEGPEWEKMVLLTFLAILENQRRKERSSSGGGGGGGP